MGEDERERVEVTGERGVVVGWAVQPLHWRTVIVLWSHGHMDMVGHDEGVICIVEVQLTGTPSAVPA